MSEQSANNTRAQQDSNMSERPTSESPQQAPGTMSTPPGAANAPRTKLDKKPFPLMKLPAELRLQIYRACFNDLMEKKKGLSTRAGIRGLYAPLLLRSSSKVRREAAPIFYKECIGNEGSIKGGHWMLKADGCPDMIVLLKAMSASLAEYAPNVTVAIYVEALSPQWGQMPHLQYISRFAMVLLSYIRSQHGVLPQGEGQDRVSTDAATIFDDDGYQEEVGGLNIWYVPGFGLRVVGPLAGLDWSGLTL